MGILRSLLFCGAAVLCLAHMVYGRTVSPIRHVVLISIDGFHSFDLRRFIRSHPHSALAKLARDGVIYNNAFSPAPADSFPGLLALVTGGKPGETGVYYDTTYDRALSPAGSGCKKKGAVVMYDETLDRAGVLHGEPLLDDNLLPRDPADGCTPVYPYDYLRVNTIFNVIGAAGGYTAWIDKHPVYQIVDGPKGPKVNDLYTPEIGENAEGYLAEGSARITASIDRTEHYDDSKMQALINEMQGYTHDRSKRAPVPTIAGMNFQTINVAQKIAGYKDAGGVPTPPLEAAFMHCDREIGKLASILKERKIFDETLIIITAKTGNGPIDPKLVRRVDPKEIARAIERAVPHSLAWFVSDRVSLIWLHKHKDTGRIVAALSHAATELHIQHILHGKELRDYFHVKKGDTRIPDIIILPRKGAIYTSNPHKLEEHGGWSTNDRNVALLVSCFHLRYRNITVDTRVSTTQVAPTILYCLGIDPDKLQAVKKDHVHLLPFTTSMLYRHSRGLRLEIEN